MICSLPPPVVPAENERVQLDRPMLNQAFQFIPIEVDHDKNHGKARPSKLSFCRKSALPFAIRIALTC
jgi:hypothetical protein